MPTKIDIKANVQSNNKHDVVGEKSLKTLRTYQLGIVYKDRYGRETPVLTNEEASFTVPKKLSNNKNSISTSVKNDAPFWAESYKYFVKETSNEYYNACMDRWYDAEDGNIWLSFPSAERNKIQEDTFIILKKKAISGLTANVPEEGRYRVIDVRNEAPDFIKTDYDRYGQSPINVLSGSASLGSNQVQFDQTTWQASQFYSSSKVVSSGAGSSTNESGFIDYPLRDVVVQFQVNPTGASTPWLDVSGIYGIAASADVFLQLSKSLSLDSGIDTITPTGTDTLQVRLAKKVIKPKTEFDGRFFVKIRRDGVIDDHIRSVGNTAPSFNVKESIQYYWIARDRPSTNAATPDKDFWEDIGERWFIDDCDRSRTGDDWGAGDGGPWHEDSGYGLIGNESGGSPMNFTAGPGVMPQEGQRGINGPNPDSNATLRCTMELSINKILDYNESGYDFSNNDSTNKAFHNKMTQHGTLFRFKEDPFQHIYKIIAQTKSSLLNSTNGSGILNYSSKSAERKNPDNKSGRLYLQFKTTGWRLNAAQVAGTTPTYEHFPDEEDKRPFAYYNSMPSGFPQQTNGTEWNPRMKGFADYTGGTSPADSSGTDLPNNASTFTAGDVTGSGNDIYTNTIEVVEIEGSSGGEVIFSDNPAVWETEPKEDIGLDIYYEVSQAYPLQLDETTNELFAPYGCTVTCDDKRRGTGPAPQNEYGLYIPPNTKLVDWGPTGHGGDTILLSCAHDEIGYTVKSLAGGATTTVNTGGNTMYISINSPNNFYGLELKFTRLDGSYTTAKIKYISAWKSSPAALHHQGSLHMNLAAMSGRVLIKLDRDLNNMNIKLPYFNCYSFGNGVESDRVRDDFNAVRLGKGVKASTVLDEPYEEEQRANGLIYSGIYNSMSGVNNLNQFIAAEKITKDVNPSYGSIQKLHQRDGDLVTFCEDKVLKIVANKDALYNADGQPQLVSSNNVLGQTTTFAGEFGISRNPESFASESFRMYFTDRQRGKVLRLSGNGIEPISSIGMKDWFADNLKLYNTLIGSFDDRKQEYNLSMTNRPMVPVNSVVTKTGGIKTLPKTKSGGNN